MSQLSFSSFDDALLVRDAQGRYLPASVDQILEAARQAIELKMQRGAPRCRRTSLCRIGPASAPPIAAGRCAAVRSTSPRHARGFAASRSFNTASSSWRTCASSSSALSGLSPA